MINTFSSFYYGHVIDENNQFLGFKEGAGAEIKATLRLGDYSLTGFAIEATRAMNEVGALTYNYSVDRKTRIITISASGSFTLLAATSAFVSASCWSLLGFNADTLSLASHSGAFASGSSWSPQMKAQSHVPFENQFSSVDGAVKKSTNGTVEAVSYGKEYIMDCEFMFITDIVQSNDCLLKSDSNGVQNAIDFMTYATQKFDLEFNPDADQPDVFYKCILERTPESQDGLGFKLKEMYGRGLPGYFETGILKFRLIS